LKFIRKLVLFIDRICTFVAKEVSYIIIFVTGVVCYGVLMRYVFKAPSIWANETMIFGCAFIYVLGGAWVMLVNGHVRMEFFWQRFSPRGRRILDCITSSFFFLYMVMLLWSGSKFAWVSIKVHETSGSPWNPPVYPIKIGFVIGVFLLLMQGISKFIKDLYFAIKEKEL